MNKKYTRIVIDVFYECIKDCPGCVKGEEYHEDNFMDSEYGCFSLYDPNDYPEYFKRIEKERKEKYTQRNPGQAENLSDLLCALSPVETPFFSSINKGSGWVEWTSPTLSKADNE